MPAGSQLAVGSAACIPTQASVVGRRTPNEAAIASARGGEEAEEHGTSLPQGTTLPMGTNVPVFARVASVARSIYHGRTFEGGTRDEASTGVREASALSTAAIDISDAAGVPSGHKVCMPQDSAPLPERSLPCLHSEHCPVSNSVHSWHLRAPCTLRATCMIVCYLPQVEKHISPVTWREVGPRASPRRTAEPNPEIGLPRRGMAPNASSPVR